MTGPDTTLEGGVAELFPPERRPSSRLREPIQVLADGKHVAIVADDDHGPDGLISVFRSFLALAGLGRTRPPPTLIIADPPFGVDDRIRVPAEETHLENVFVHVGDVAVL